MTNTIQVETRNLEGVALDFAVAVYKGLVCVVDGVYEEFTGGVEEFMEGYTPSTDPGQGFPILVENKVSLNYLDDGEEWVGCISIGETQSSYHKDPLVAGLRAVVHFHLGSVVDIPEELMGDE